MHYFNFERSPSLAEAFVSELDPQRILLDLSFKVQQKIDPYHDLVILDEIQACPNALTSLKYFCEELPASYICCAGSLLGVYLAPASYPVGKVEHLQMYPMSFLEFLQALEDDLSLELLQGLTLNDKIPALVHEHLWQRLKHYFITGGLPEIVSIYIQQQDDLFSGFKQVRHKQQDLIQAYFADIVKHAGKLNAMHINRIWQSIPEQLGNTKDGSAQKYKFKGAVPGIDRFSKLADAIDWLDAAGLIHKVSIVNRAELPLAAFCKDNSFKLFLFDIGILGAMLELEPGAILDYDYGSCKGFFAENYVVQAFIGAGQSRLFSWMEKTAEVEFLRPVGNQIIPIEVKSGWVTQAKSLRVFANKYHPSYRAIMSAKSLHIDAENQVHNYPLYLAALFPLAE